MNLCVFFCFFIHYSCGGREEKNLFIYLRMGHYIIQCFWNLVGTDLKRCRHIFVICSCWCDVASHKLDGCYCFSGGAHPFGRRLYNVIHTTYKKSLVSWYHDSDVYERLRFCPHFFSCNDLLGGNPRSTGIIVISTTSNKPSSSLNTSHWQLFATVGPWRIQRPPLRLRRLPLHMPIHGRLLMPQKNQESPRSQQAPHLASTLAHDDDQSKYPGCHTVLKSISGFIKHIEFRICVDATGSVTFEQIEIEIESSFTQNNLMVVVWSVFFFLKNFSFFRLMNLLHTDSYQGLDIENIWGECRCLRLISD